MPIDPEIPELPIIKEPFRMYEGEEEISRKKKASWTLTVRINRAERILLNDIKGALRIHTDGTALKICARVGFNVLQGSIGIDILRYLTDPLRRRELLDNARK